MGERLDKRIEFHGILEEILGSKQVYFNPGSDTKLKYDCIVYKRSNPDVIHADNIRYISHELYRVTVISRDSDCDVVDRLLKRFKMASIVTPTYPADGLYHDVLNIYY